MVKDIAADEDDDDDDDDYDGDDDDDDDDDATTTKTTTMTTTYCFLYTPMSKSSLHACVPLRLYKRQCKHYVCYFADKPFLSQFKLACVLL